MSVVISRPAATKRKTARKEAPEAPPAKAAKRAKDTTITVAAAASVAPSRPMFVVRELHKEAWSGFGDAHGHNYTRQLVGVYTTPLEANRVAVHRFYHSAKEHELNFEKDGEYDCDEVICEEKGPHKLLQLQCARGEEGRQTLTVRVTEHAVDDTSTMTAKEYEGRLKVLRKRGAKADGATTINRFTAMNSFNREPKVDNDDEDPKPFKLMSTETAEQHVSGVRRIDQAQEEWVSF